MLADQAADKPAGNKSTDWLVESYLADLRKRPDLGLKRPNPGPGRKKPKKYAKKRPKIRKKTAKNCKKL